ncbi:dehydrogenase/reductase SDR family member 11-like [Lineus longissimus]|uniref:dehydrogenase/reductase SDR family member 11-like n=1 Tax=Lineus longissimus TaxID=88925 RepID=UPI00315DC38D
MERWVGRVALVTGASSGIGAEMTRTLVKRGMKVVGCDRTIEGIEAIAEELKDEKGSVLPIQCDLRDTEQIAAMFKKIRQTDDFGGVDVCVNNAGVAYPAPLAEGDEEKWRAMLELNVLGLSVVTREAIKSMKARNVDDGHIIHMNSMSGHRVTPMADTHFYSATKYAVTALTEGLRQELRAMKSNIRVTSISPGLVETAFFEVLFDGDQKKIESLYKRVTPLQPSDVADALLYALSAPARVQVHDILIRPTDQPL